MLEVRSLEVSYGAIRAVRGIDLDVAEGEVVALLGPNGAGKTSALRAITGLEPFRGSVRYDGLDVRKLGPEGCARHGLIHVPEGRRLFSTLTVHENLQIGTIAANGRRPAYDIDAVYELFPSLVGLRTRLAWALSGGEQQMVAIARALVAAPRLLLLDEPSLGLAPIVVKSVFAALREVSAHTPILLVEQNTGQALRIAGRAATLVGGRIVLSGSASDLASRSALLDTYLGQATPSESTHG
jgi:branched-chain amino acid transport system ATP-binding protein